MVPVEILKKNINSAHHFLEAGDYKSASEKLEVILKSVEENPKDFFEKMEIREENESSYYRVMVVLKKGNVGALSKLIEGRGPFVTPASFLGNTLFHFAAIWNLNQEMFEFLYKKGYSFIEQNARGDIPLHMAASCGALNFIRVFLSYLAKDKGTIYLESENYAGHTPLQLTVIHTQIEALKLLLDCNANSQHQDKEGCTVFHLAVKHNRTTVLKFLIQYFSQSLNLPSRVQVTNNLGQTALHLAGELGLIDAVKLLSLSHVYMEVLDNEGMTPLHRTIISNRNDNSRLETVQTLVNLGASIQTKNRDRQDALQLAEKYGRSAIVNYLKTYVLTVGFKGIVSVKPSIRNWVFQGGSVKGVAYLGALRRLVKEPHFRFEEIHRIGGTSAGAITATLLSVGYSIDEMEDILINLKFEDFLDGEKQKKEFIAIKKLMTQGGVINWMQIFWKLITEFGAELTGKRGIFSGENFREWIEAKISAKTGIAHMTFADLDEHIKSGNKLNLRYLYVVGTNLMSSQTDVFSHDTEATRHVIISDAVRISMSIPFLFRPHRPYIREGGKVQGKRVPIDSLGFYIDGGVSDNYPIWLFDKLKYLESAYDKAMPDDKSISEMHQINPQTLGFRLVSSDILLPLTKDKSFVPKSEPMKNFTSFLTAFVMCYLEKQESDHAKRQEDRRRTIYIDTVGIGMLDFDLSDINKENLKNAAYRATDEFLEQFQLSHETINVSPGLLENFVAAARSPSIVRDQRGFEIRNIDLEPAKIPKLLYTFYSKGTDSDRAFLNSCKINFNLRDDTGKSAVHYAMERSDFECLGRLLKSGHVFLDIKDNSGNTLLDIACDEDNVDERNKRLILLLKAGVKVIKETNLGFIQEIREKPKMISDREVQDLAAGILDNHKAEKRLQAHVKHIAPSLKKKENSGVSGIQEEEDEVDFSVSEKLIQGIQKIEVAKGKNLVLVLGNTGSGKSTVVNYLLGCKMKEKQLPGKVVGVEVDGVGFAKIGHSPESQTLYPEIFPITGTDYALCDCAGFGDTRLEEDRLSINITLRLAVAFAKQIRSVILVIDYNDLSAKAKPFRALGSTLSKLFKNVSDIENSVSFLITKTRGETTTEDILQIVEEITSHTKNKGQIIADKIKLKLSKAGTKESVREELSELEDQMRIFNLMKRMNVEVVNVFNESHRKQLSDFLFSGKGNIPKTAFEFTKYDEAAVKFDRVVFNLVQLGSAKFQRRIELVERIGQYNNEVKKSNEKIQTLEAQIKEFDTSTVIDKMHAMSLKILEEQGEYEKELEAVQIERNKELREIKALQEDYDSLDSDELLLHQEDQVHEERAPFGFFGWTKKEFEYSGIPFEKAEFVCKNGKFKDIEEDKATGRFKITYESGYGKDGIASVKIYIKKKDKPDNKKRMEALSQEIRRKKASCGYSQDRINSLKNRIISCGDKIKSLNDDKKTLKEKIQRQKQILQEEIRELMNRIAFLNPELVKLGKELSDVSAYIMRNFGRFKIIEQVANGIDYSQSALVQNFLSQFNVFIHAFPEVRRLGPGFLAESGDKVVRQELVERWGSQVRSFEGRQGDQGLRAGENQQPGKALTPMAKVEKRKPVEPQNFKPRVPISRL